MKTLKTIFFNLPLTLFLLIPIMSSAEDKHLPISAGEYLDVKAFKVTNRGECPIYKVEMWTLPPDSSILQRITKSASFKANIGTIEKGYYKTVKFNELINDEGKRLDDSYVIGSVKFRGSHCGEDLNNHIDWRD